MRHWYICIFSLLAAFRLSAQQADTVAVSENVPVLRPALYFDYGKGLTNLIGYEDKIEGAASLLFFNQYEIVGELGYARLSPEEAYTNADYHAEGTYFRIGGGYLFDIVQRSKLGLGVRYGMSRFDEKGFFRVVSDYHEIAGRHEGSFGADNIEARWWEIVLTSDKMLTFNKEEPEARINHLFAIGFFLRVRFLVAYDKREELDVYSIPGYGKSIDKGFPALNFFVKAYIF